MEGYFPENIVDHENKDKSDNRWINLRHVTYRGNGQNMKIAKNNKSVFNSGYLPNVVGNSGASYSNDNSTATRQDGTSVNINNAESSRYNGSIGLNYTVFNGFANLRTFDKLKLSKDLSEAQLRLTIENAIITTFFNAIVRDEYVGYTIWANPLDSNAPFSVFDSEPVNDYIGVLNTDSTP